MNRGKLFGTSGIRGVVNEELSPDLCRQVGLSLGTTLPPSSRVCIATDTRTSRELIKEAVGSGLLSCSIDVVDLGILPTPALALLTREMGFAAGIMITASHNPPEFNGIKLFAGDSLGYGAEEEQEIERVFHQGCFREGKTGKLEQGHGMKERYLSFLKGKFSPSEFSAGLRIVVDPGNGAAAGFAGDILARMGLDVLPVNDEPDGRFPGRSPEPKEDTLQDTVAFLREHDADLAVCFDGDADRVVFCDGEGFLGFNECIAFISRLVINRTGRKRVATTVEAGTLLDLAVKDLGAEVVRGRVGDVPVAHLVRKLDAALGVEEVGVYIIPEAGPYPDSIFASLVLLSRLSDAGQIRRFFQSIPRLYFEKAKVSCPNELKEKVMAGVKEKAHLFAPDEVNALDGLRLEFPDSWMLIRASGTEPVIRVISESTSQQLTGRLVTNGSELVKSLVEASS
jgi:phosphoglucosamine mutase